jgi:hypothetical protein
MKVKGDFVGSWWAKKGSYGHKLANNPGEGAGHLSGATGGYASASTKAPDYHDRPGKKIANSPGKGAGPQNHSPVGGKKGRLPRSSDGKKGHYNKSFSSMHQGDD